MKIITANVNGIRAAEKKGFFNWLAAADADVVCLQEIKAQEEQLSVQFYPSGYYVYYHPAQKKGYSGTAIFARQKPNQVSKQTDWRDMDEEGRFIQADFGDLSVISLYLPSGSAKQERQDFKMAFLTERFMPYLQKIRQDGRNYIICGDWNIAHKKIDLKNWRSNQKNSGFLPAERAWMDALFGTVGFVGAFRVLNPDEGQYTWWSNRGQAWANNTGWRIDYQVISPSLRRAVKAVFIYKTERFSDHAPLIIDYVL